MILGLGLGLGLDLRMILGLGLGLGLGEFVPVSPSSGPMNPPQKTDYFIFLFLFLFLWRSPCKWADAPAK